MSNIKWFFRPISLNAISFFLCMFCFCSLTLPLFTFSVHSTQITWFYCNVSVMRLDASYVCTGYFKRVYRSKNCLFMCVYLTFGRKKLKCTVLLLLLLFQRWMWNMCVCVFVFLSMMHYFARMNEQHLKRTRKRNLGFVWVKMKV